MDDMNISSEIAVGDPTSVPTDYPDVALSLESRSIRLLTIYLDNSGTICGHLEAFEFASCPPYMALSYEWGVHPPARCITLQAKMYMIRENLFNAMHAILHHKSRTGAVAVHPEDCLADDDGGMLQYIWIDSICINQADVYERNHQVNLMNVIYSQATVVVAWLGLANDLTAKTMQDFQQFRRRPYFTFIKTLISRRLASFFDLEYFHRAWIVQEIVLSRRLIFLCGQDAINGRVVRKCGMDHLSVLSKPGGRILYSHALDRDLTVLIQHFFSSKCYDARDRVYSLLGIAENECGTYLPSNVATKVLPSVILKPSTPGFLTKHNITANYSLSPFELYLQLVRINGHFGTVLRAQKLEFLGPLNGLILGIPGHLLIPFDTTNYTPEELSNLRYPEGVHWRPGRGFKWLKSISSGQQGGAPLIDFIPTRWIYNSLSLKSRIASTEFLAYVRDLDWTHVESWPANYRAMQRYSRSRSRSFLVRLEDLERSQMRLVEWATDTLGQKMDERLEDAIARMAGKISPWQRWGSGLISLQGWAVKNRRGNAGEVD